MAVSPPREGREAGGDREGKGMGERGRETGDPEGKGGEREGQEAGDLKVRDGERGAGGRET